ncbi:uncharacterized protein An06g02190 [Aspergillus niger]|uniref:Contig An06c0090, genomic contig n=2 Tax=Aspergillus niger TaxID=5061 RepID=A2QLR7_ASPNC|nr:uncharacterized protein An06g02190 [Aspergillus niger]CAK48062.1 unnamed protein product [Aspergillus niger]
MHNSTIICVGSISSVMYCERASLAGGSGRPRCTLPITAEAYRKKGCTAGFGITLSARESCQLYSEWLTVRKLFYNAL